MPALPPLSATPSLSDASGANTATANLGSAPASPATAATDASHRMADILVKLDAATSAEQATMATMQGQEKEEQRAAIREAYHEHLLTEMTAKRKAMKKELRALRTAAAQKAAERDAMAKVEFVKPSATAPRSATAGVRP